MNEPLEEQYFQWLYRKVASVRLKNPARTCWSLLRQLHHKEFVWSVHNDDNRLMDGLELRDVFLQETGAENERNWYGLGCSMLEMLIALAGRLEYDSLENTEADEWFWLLMQNIELNEYTDLYFKNEFTAKLVDDALERVIYRTYEPDGRGGLFPLQDPHGDQRNVELWYQMSSYLLERF